MLLGGGVIEKDSAHALSQRFRELSNPCHHVGIVEEAPSMSQITSPFPENESAKAPCLELPSMHLVWDFQHAQLCNIHFCC